MAKKNFHRAMVKVYHKAMEKFCERIWRIANVFQVQRPFQDPNSKMGGRPVQHERMSGAMAVHAEHVGLFGGSLRRRRHCQAVAQGIV